MKAAYGYVENVKKLPSRQEVVVSIVMPVEAYVSAVMLLDGKKVLVTVSELDVPYGILDSDKALDSEDDDTFYGNPLPEDVPKEKLGPLAQWAVMRCKEPSFWLFLNGFIGANLMGWPVTNEQSAKEAICKICSVDSRKDLDRFDLSGICFKEKIMQPWSVSPFNPHKN